MEKAAALVEESLVVAATSESRFALIWSGARWGKDTQQNSLGPACSRLQCARWPVGVGHEGIVEMSKSGSCRRRRHCRGSWLLPTSSTTASATTATALVVNVVALLMIFASEGSLNQVLAARLVVEFFNDRVKCGLVL
jgi:hypothetical protein